MTDRTPATRPARDTGDGPTGVEGLLLDLDGTLYAGETPLPGAIEAIAALAERQVPRRYLTNTTRLSRARLARKLEQMGFPIAPGELFTAPVAAARWLRDRGVKRVALHAPAAVRDDFAEFEISDAAPEAIVVGDLGRDWSYDRLNAAFRHLLDGATLVALQKNRYWRADDGRLALDAGPFVAALEYAARCEAVIVGKPSPSLFRLASDSLGVAPAGVLVIGDDVESDVAGAQAAGMRGALVRTGKYREDVVRRSGIEPDLIADTLGDLVRELLGPERGPAR